MDSNHRPSGYEPDELPLLHAASMAGLYHATGCLSNMTRHRASRSLAGSCPFDARFDRIDTTSSLALGTMRQGQRIRSIKLIRRIGYELARGGSSPCYGREAACTARHRFQVRGKCHERSDHDHHECVPRPEESDPWDYLVRTW